MYLNQTSKNRVHKKRNPFSFLAFTKNTLHKHALNAENGGQLHVSLINAPKPESFGHATFLSMMSMGLGQVQLRFQDHQKTNHFIPLHL